MAEARRYVIDADRRRRALVLALWRIWRAALVERWEPCPCAGTFIALVLSLPRPASADEYSRQVAMLEADDLQQSLRGYVRQHPEWSRRVLGKLRTETLLAPRGSFAADEDGRVRPWTLESWVRQVQSDLAS